MLTISSDKREETEHIEGNNLLAKSTAISHSAGLTIPESANKEKSKLIIGILKDIPKREEFNQSHSER